jgi:predicted transcriptional regulator
MVLKKGWSFKEQRHLIELANSSKSLDEVAEAMGRKPKTVRKMAMRLGVSFKPKHTEK